MTHTELAILGLIIEAPRHGYEIEQLIEQRNMRSWTEIGFSSIYYILSKLERRGWLSSRSQPAAGRGPQRKVYAARPAGRKAWAAATLQLLADPGQPRPFLLGLAGLPGLPAGEALAALRQYRRGLLQRRGEVEAAWQSGGQLPYFLDGMIEYSFNLLQTEIEWLDRYIPRLESHLDQ